MPRLSIALNFLAAGMLLVTLGLGLFEAGPHRAAGWVALALTLLAHATAAAYLTLSGHRLERAPGLPDWVAAQSIRNRGRVRAFLIAGPIAIGAATFTPTGRTQLAVAPAASAFNLGALGFVTISVAVQARLVAGLRGRIAAPPAPLPATEAARVGPS